MKKKIIALLLVLALAVSCIFVFSSCNKPSEDDPGNTTTEDPAKPDVDEGFDPPAKGEDPSTPDDPAQTGSDIVPENGKNPAEDNDDFTVIG